MKMKKLIGMVLTLSMLVAMLAGCTASSTQETSSQQSQSASSESVPPTELPEITINAATIFQEETAIVQGVKKMAEILKKKSGGKITVNIFAGGTTGGEKEQAEALKVGEIQMAAFGTLPISIYVPAYSFFDSPFVFRDRDHFMNVWNSKLGDEMREKMLADHNLKTLGVMGRGYRHITSNIPINSIDDIAKLTIRTPESALFMETFAALGATCVPIALTELFTSLQMGVVNASEGPFDQLVSNKLYEVQDYITLSKYYYSISMWQMNAEFYDSLPAEYQTMIDEAAAEATEYATELAAEMETTLKKQCEDAGVQFCEMTDMTPYLEKVEPVMEKFFKERWPVTTPDEIAEY